MGRVKALVLAAGFSRRMKKNKLLLPFRGSTVIENTVIGLLHSQVDGVAVVLGNEKERVRQILNSYPVQFIENSRFAQGMSSSIQEGIKSIIDDSDIDGVLIIPGDMPFVQSQTVNGVLKMFRDSSRSIIIPVYQGKKGHPALFAKSLFPQLLQISGDMGAREVVRNNASQCFMLDVDDPGILTDIDCPEEYEHWYQMSQKDT